MQRRGFPITGSIIFAAGVVLGLAAFGGSTSSAGQNDIPSGSAAFEAGAGAHETRTQSQTALEFPNVSEIPAQAETGLPQGPVTTRSSFMASWGSVSGAIGYRLDVSTSSSFSSYVDGQQDLDVGNVTGWVVTGLNPGTTYYYRVRAYDATSLGRYSDIMTVTTTTTAGLIIHPTFHSSITSNPNAAAIEAMIIHAISIHESLFSDPVTAQILFRYSATAPDGTPLPAGTISRSDYVYYMIPWNTYSSALRADANTSNDVLANASLPGTALSANVNPSSASGRTVGLNTPPDMSANGTIGGPFDGIVTLNSAVPFQFTRPPSATRFDAQRVIEHEMDEVLGLGSHLNSTGSDLRPQDLFSWSAGSHRNVSSTGSRYFSINHGITNIVNFNQNSTGDYGDWLSTACPQTHPYVQNAFGCAGQSSDVMGTSPEGVNLDVIGYDLVNAPTTDFNSDGKPDFVLYNAGTRQTVVWYMNNNVHAGGGSGPTLPGGWSMMSVADFNRDGHPDYALFKPSTREIVIRYLSGLTSLGGAYAPTLPSGWELVATGDFNGDGKPDFVLYRSSTRQTAVWYMNNNMRIGSAYGPTLITGWNLVGVADFNGDTNPDYLLFNPSTRQSVIWYLSGIAHIASAAGPTITAGYNLMGAADFDGNGGPDYVLYNSSTHRTVLWYMSNRVRIGSAYGPTIPGSWSLVAP
jgi:elongation factor P hydroxylase